PMRPVLRGTLALIALVSFLGGTPRLTQAQDATPAPAAVVEPPSQPSQPATGPGGAEVAYDGIRAQHYGPQPDGAAEPTGYWLFEPVGPHAGPAAGPLPLVLFLHGFDVTDPEIYHAWIDHLVRRGAIVIFPDYQTANLPFPAALAPTDHSAPKVIQTA